MYDMLFLPTILSPPFQTNNVDKRNQKEKYRGGIHHYLASDLARVVTFLLIKVPLAE